MLEGSSKTGNFSKKELVPPGRLHKENTETVHENNYFAKWYLSSCMPGWMKHRLESRLLGEIPITSDMQMTPPLWQELKRN